MSACAFCGRRPLTEDPQAAEILVAEIAREFSTRLWRAEGVIAGMSEAARIEVASWLGGMLKRPPLANPTGGWIAVRALIEGLWWDIESMTPDPLSPTVTDANGVEGMIPATHPALIDSHPWGPNE